MLRCRALSARPSGPWTLGIRAGLVVALLLVGLLPTRPAYAATFTVTTTQDAPHMLPINGNCTSTLPGNLCTLRAAITAANFLGGGPHTINLSVAGVYLLTVTGANEDFAQTGDLDVNGTEVTIANTSPGTVIIDGNLTDRVFDVGPVSSARLTLSGVTVQRGNQPSGSGGGIQAGGATMVTLNDVIVTDNKGGISGGTSTTITGGAVTNNTVGGVASSHITVSNSNIASNGAFGLRGATVTVSNSTVQNHSGPGVAATAPTSSLTIQNNSQVSGNGVGVSGEGGHSVSINVSDSSITGNGGGLVAEGLISVVNSTVSNQTQYAIRTIMKLTYLLNKSGRASAQARAGPGAPPPQGVW